MRVIQQKDFSNDLYKTTKHNYFSLKTRDVGKPKDTEIAQIALFYMIRKGMIKTELNLKKILDLPFFSRNVFKPEIFFEALKLKNPNSIVVIEPSMLDNSEYVQKIEDEIKQKIIIENQAQFEEQRKIFQTEIDERKRELAIIPTRFKNQNYEEPKVEEREEKPMQEWWQILNLRDDPFPLAEGFQKINKEIYENIVVRTEIFKKYVNYAETLRDQIFKNTIFYGEFGSGKTAFFDYLKVILLRKKILTVYVQLWVGLDNDTNIYKFEEQLISKLLDECNRYGVTVNDVDHKHHPTAINNILQQLVDQRNFIGLIIFVDDLHKNTKAFDSALDFLSYLQIFTSESTKEKNVNVATYVAGIPQWKAKIDSEPRLSGSLIRQEFMPSISEEDAYYMLNNRMLTFSKNQDKKNIIGKAFVKQIYETLKKNNISITFREFLKWALDEFRNSNFDRVLSVNPRAIPTDTLHEIHNEIYENPKLAYQFDSLFLLFVNAQQENKQKCFEILGNIFLDHGILESSPQAERNSWAFEQLIRSGLIHYVEEGKDVKWFVNKDLIDINKQIINKYNFSMEDYLIPSFLGKSILKKKNHRNLELEILETLAKGRNKSNEQQIINEVIKSYKPLIDIESSHALTIVPKEIVEKCIRSLSSLTSAFILLENTSPLEGDDLTIINFWKEFWYKPSSMIEFINQIERKDDLDVNSANFILGLHKEAFIEIVTFLQDQDTKDKIFSIAYKNLTNDDCKVIDKTRDLWSNKDYFVMCSVIVEYLENKIRNDLFNIMTLIYGDNENHLKRFDEKILHKIKDKIIKDEKKGFSLVKNELQHLDRKDYKILMTKGPPMEKSEIGHKNWEEVFSHLFAPWTEEQLYNFLDKFGDYNTSTSHNKTEAISSSQQPDLRQFVIDSMFFIQRLNSSYRKLIKSGITEKESKFYFSFNKNVDTSTQNYIEASPDEFIRIKNRMVKMGETVVPIHDNEYVLTFFGLSYRKFVMIIGLLLNMNEEKRKKIGVELTILEDNSPNFRFKLNPIMK